MQSNNQITDERYSMRLCLEDLGHDEIFINGYMRDIYYDNDLNPMEQYISFMDYRYNTNRPTQNIQDNIQDNMDVDVDLDMETQNIQDNMDSFELNDETAMKYLNNNIRRNDMSRHNNTRVNRNTINNRSNSRHRNTDIFRSPSNNRRNRRHRNRFFNMFENNDIENQTENNDTGLMYTTMLMGGLGGEMVFEHITSSNNSTNIENMITIIESILPPGFIRLSEGSLMDGFQQLLQRSIGDTGAKHRDVLKNNAADELKNKNTYSYNELKLKIKIKDIDKESCPVCLEPIKPESDMDDSYNKKVLLKLLCGHIFHSVCVIKWLTEGDHRCPVCRTSCGNHHEIKDRDN